MPAERLRRVLVTGVGGPAGIAVMRTIAVEMMMTLAGPDTDPDAAGLYLVPEPQRAIVPPGDDPQFADVLLELCRRELIDVVVPTVDVELLPLARRRERFEAAAAVALVLAEESTLEVCLDKRSLDACCRKRVRVPDCLACRRRLRLAGAGHARDRQAAPGQRLPRPAARSGDEASISRGSRAMER